MRGVNRTIGVECPPDLAHIDIRDAWEREVVLTARDWAVLRAIYHADQNGIPHLTHDELALAVGCGRNGIRQNLDRLSLAGFIRWKTPVTEASPYILRVKERQMANGQALSASQPVAPKPTVVAMSEVWVVRVERGEGLLQTVAMARSVEIGQKAAMVYARAKANGGRRELLLPWECQKDGRWVALIGEPRRRDLARWYVVDRWPVLTGEADLQALDRQLRRRLTSTNGTHHAVISGSRG